MRFILTHKDPYELMRRFHEEINDMRGYGSLAQKEYSLESMELLINDVSRGPIPDTDCKMGYLGRQVRIWNDTLRDYTFNPETCEKCRYNQANFHMSRLRPCNITKPTRENTCGDCDGYPEKCAACETSSHLRPEQLCIKPTEPESTNPRAVLFMFNGTFDKMLADTAVDYLIIDDGDKSVDTDKLSNIKDYHSGEPFEASAFREIAVVRPDELDHYWKQVPEKTPSRWNDAE